MKKIIFLSLLDLNLYLFRLPIMKELIQQGWDVIALTPPGNYSHQFSQHGIRHISFPMVRQSVNPFREILTICHLYRLFKKERPDILHTFTIKPNIYGTIAAKFASISKIINTVTGLGSFYIEKNFKAFFFRNLISFLYRVVFCFSDYVIFQNDDDKNLFIFRKIVSSEKAMVIRSSGIDTQLWQNIYEPKKSDIVTVLMIGRLLIHKGVYEYLHMAKMLKQKYHDRVRFLLVGDIDPGSHYSISQQALDHSVQSHNIEYLGFQDNIQPIMAQADIFVLPSYREGVPRTCIEAASMGLPIVTTNAVGCKEVVDDGVSGFLVPIQDVQQLTQKVEALILDEVLRKKMGEKSREKAVREFDIKEIVRQYMVLY